MFIVYGTKYKLRIKIIKLNKLQIFFHLSMIQRYQRGIKIMIMIINIYNYIIFWTLSE